MTTVLAFSCVVPCSAAKVLGNEERLANSFSVPSSVKVAPLVALAIVALISFELLSFTTVLLAAMAVC